MTKVLLIDGTKMCSQCLQTKPSQAFHRQAGQSSGLRSACKLCIAQHRATPEERLKTAASQKRWLAKNRDKKLAYSGELLASGQTRGSKASTEAHRRKQAFINAFKEMLGCKVCGEEDAVVLDMHHRDEEEKLDALRGVSRTRLSAHSWKIIISEVNKCDVLCANCYRRETAYKTSRRRF